MNLFIALAPDEPFLDAFRDFQYRDGTITGEPGSGFVSAVRGDYAELRDCSVNGMHFDRVLLFACSLPARELNPAPAATGSSRSKSAGSGRAAR